MTTDKDKRMDDERINFIQPEGWARPRGYSNGVAVRGRTLYIAGQIGWNAQQQFEHDDLLGQFVQTLDNVIAVAAAAGAAPSDIVKMTCYCTDVAAYRECAGKLGGPWRERFGKHYPAMALVGVSELVEPRAKIEIEAVVSLPLPEEQ